MCLLRPLGGWVPFWMLICMFNRSDGHFFNISAPGHHTVFQGNLKVKFNISTNPVQVQLVSKNRNTTKTLFNLELKDAGDPGVGEFEIQCRGFSHAGIYVVRLLNITDKEVVSETAAVNVTWPDISIKIPEQHIAETHQMDLQMSVKTATCDNDRPNVYYIRLVYYGEIFSVEDIQGEAEIIQSDSVIEVTKLTRKTYPCHLLDRAGLYRVILVYIRDPTPVAQSNVLVAKWSSNYDLDVHQESVLPCVGSVTIAYRHPPCIGNLDKIRLFERTKPSGSIAARTEFHYSQERSVKKDSPNQQVQFGCAVFNASIPVYCFRYISFAHNNAISERAMKCIPTEKNAGPVVDGGWAEWQSWSSCSETCGAGMQVRVRSCDNPPPSAGGAYCPENENVESQPCGSTCKPTPTPAPLTPVTMSPDCACGCVLYTKQGFITPSRWCYSSNVWIVEASKQDEIITLEFKEFNLDHNSQWIKVRDGDSRAAPELIKQWTGNVKPPPVRTKSTSLFIEFVSNRNVEQYNQRPTGFLAVFKAEVANSSVIGVAPQDNAEFWKSTLVFVILGATVCGVLVVAFVIFVFYQQFKKEKIPEKDHPGHESLLINGEIPNSPSHSSAIQVGSHTPGSANISYTDVSPTKWESMLAKGVSTDGVIAKFPDRNYKDHDGRQVKFGGDPETRRSSGSSNACSCGSPVRQCPTGASEKIYKEEAKKPVDKSHSSHKHQHKHKHHRRRHSPESQAKAAYKSRRRSSGSPERKHSPTKIPNKAVQEDLSPKTSPTRSPTKVKPMDTIAEHIPMDSYSRYKYNRQRKHYEDTAIDNAKPPPGERPPAEGGDSSKRRSRGSPDREKQRSKWKNPTTPDSQNANYIPSTDNGKPRVKPLPLRNVPRPDGQSPENINSEDKTNANTPESISSSIFTLSPGKKFPNMASETGTPTEDAYEYDDFIPEIPGSFLNMDHNAYTLTWSNQPAWAAKKANTEPSADPSEVSVEVHPHPKESHT